MVTTDFQCAGNRMVGSGVSPYVVIVLCFNSTVIHEMVHVASAHCTSMTHLEFGHMRTCTFALALNVELGGCGAAAVIVWYNVLPEIMAYSWIDLLWSYTIIPVGLKSWKSVKTELGE